MSEFLNKILKIKSSKPYIDYYKYHQGNIFGITKTSRWELMHSNFIAWALAPDSSHQLRFYPLQQFVQLIDLVQNTPDNINARMLDPVLLYKFSNSNYIVGATIEREKAHIDLLIQIQTQDKILPIILENKVESSENGKNKDQTQVYFKWAEAEFADKSKYFSPLYIYLYPEYNSSMQKSQEYIRMTYQSFVNYVLEPSMVKCGDTTAINNYRTYLQCLSFQSDSEKGGHTMAISTEEKRILSDFLEENRDLLCAVLEELDDLPAAVKAAVTSTLKDNSKYDFNGSVYKKRRLVLAMVQHYHSTHPNATYSDYTNEFDAIFSSKPWVRKYADLSPKEISDKRAFVDDSIKLVDGTIIVVNNQISDKDIPEILRVANKLSYTINKV